MRDHDEGPLSPEEIEAQAMDEWFDRLERSGAYDDITGFCEQHPSHDRNHEVTTITSPDGTLKVLKSAPPELVAGVVLHSLDLYDAARLQVTQ